MLNQRIAHKKSKQLALEFPNGWGGRRRGAGRKPKGERAGVPHRPREEFTRHQPVHVTVRLVDGLPSLRKAAEFERVTESFRRVRGKESFRLVHFSVLSNHMHLIVEADDPTQLGRGMQGLLSGMARRLNRLWGRTGSVFGDRFHHHALKVPREVRNVLHYVLNNARKHGLRLDPRRPDPRSSGRWLDGWRDYVAERLAGILPTTAPRTWLLRKAWRRHGLLSLAGPPGG